MLTKSQEELFESLIFEAKSAGRQWTRTGNRVQCEDGRCVLGFIIYNRRKELAARGAGFTSAYSYRAVTVEDAEKFSNPPAYVATQILQLDKDTLRYIIQLNDGYGSLEELKRFDELLGVSTQVVR